MKNFNIYEMVNDSIVKRLEAGVVPWHMPWKTASNFPKNLVSKKAYRGFNFWYLLSFGFESPWFLTFNQAKQLGGYVRKGANAYRVIFWKRLENKEDPSRIVSCLRYYNVFHIGDVQNIDPKKIPQSYDRDFNPIDSCDRLVEEWADCPAISHNAEYAAYVPSLDIVKIPSARTFFKDEHFYSILFHELVHSTGHRSRLDRHSKFRNLKFGSNDYSKEELVAEMGAAYLCAMTGIENETIDNSAAYIDGWLNNLKKDNRFFLQAASYAQLAVDYIIGNPTHNTSETVVDMENINSTSKLLI